MTMFGVNVPCFLCIVDGEIVGFFFVGVNIIESKEMKCYGKIHQKLKNGKEKKKTTKVAKSKKEREKNEERRYGEKRNLLPYDYLLVGLLEVQLLFCAFDKIYIESIRINKHTTHGAVMCSVFELCAILKEGRKSNIQRPTSN